MFDKRKDLFQWKEKFGMDSVLLVFDKQKTLHRDLLVQRTSQLLVFSFFMVSSLVLC